MKFDEVARSATLKIVKLEVCFLKNIQVAYGGDRYTAHSTAVNRLGETGNPPTRTVLTMTFQELEVLTRPRIEQGF